MRESARSEMGKKRPFTFDENTTQTSGRFAGPDEEAKLIK